MALSDERLARNQAIYREVNERITELLGAPGGATDFLCECSSEECTETVALTDAEYDRVRNQPTTFFVVPGHEMLEIERIVATTSTYLVVDKIAGRDAVAALARSRS